MSSIPSNLARVSGNMISSLLTSNLRRTNVDLFNVQEQIATGLRVNRPSDDASVVATINSLRRILEQDDQKLNNLAQAQGLIDTADFALGDVSNMLLEAQSIASSQVGIGSDADTRANQAQVIQAMLDELLRTANRELNGIYLFGGETSADDPFVSQAGGIRYVGARSDLVTDIGLGSTVGVNLNGADAFGALSARVQGDVDLDPDITAETRLVDVEGARGRGITLGTVNVNVDGANTQVDLRGADTVLDVANRLIDAITPANGAIIVSGSGMSIAALPGHTITISDIGQSFVAADLGIDLTADASASAVPVTVAGGDLDAHVTELTEVTAITAPFDTAGGLKVTNGALATVIDFSGAATVQDMINQVEAADVGVRLEISEDHKTLRLVNEISGTELSVGENAGGSTAGDLGLRTFGDNTLLSDFNFGRGVQTATGDDIQIHLHDGTDVFVDLSAAATVSDVVAAINAAGGGSVTATLAADGNGLVVNDLTVGGDSFVITDVGQSLAATDLGIRKNAGAAGALAGDDVAKERVDSLFTHLMMLRDGLLSNDERLITEAGGKISQDINTAASARAQMGVRSQRVAQQVVRTEELTLQNQSLLGEVRDADLNEAITRFVQLQQQLQANLLTGQQLLNMSLLDFLR